MDRLFTLVLVASLLLGGPVPRPRAVAAPLAHDLRISQIYGAGGNAGATYRSDFIELHNAGTAAVDLDGYSVQYASATGAFSSLTPLSGLTIAPGSYVLVKEADGASGNGLPLPAPDITGTISMGATSGKVALAHQTTAIAGLGDPAVVDFVGYGGATTYEGSGPATGLDTALSGHRAGAGCVDTDDNALDFGVATPAPRNSGSAAHACDAGALVLADCGGPLVLHPGQAAHHPVSARDADGRVAALAVTGVSPSPAPGAMTAVNVIPAPGPGLTATAQISITGAVPPGNYFVRVTATNDDAPTPQTGICTLAVHVLYFIGQVQGSVPDSLADPFTFASPYLGQTVTLDGIVTDRILNRSSTGATTYRGFFLQEMPADSDGDPLTSDGLHVFMGTSASFSGYTPALGDHIVVRGVVTEYYNDTELVTPTLVAHLGNVGSVNLAVPAVPITPTGTLTETGRMYERVEGMRVPVPAGAPVVAPTYLFAGYNDTEFFVVHPDHPVAQRTDPYARRVFRDGHPLDWGGADGNPWRISIEAQVLKGNANNAGLNLPAASVYDVVSDTLRGPVVYAFERYTINVEDMPVLIQGVEPLANNPPAPPDRAQAYSVANYNLENLYDYLNDPFDDCDFAGDPGCIGVEPPFDYVPLNAAEYQTRTIKVARAVLDALYAPDILAVQEVEDQDVCAGGGQVYGTCGSANNADGRPDALQDVAREIYLRSGGVISYGVAFDRIGADARGIIQGFLWRTDRVVLAPPDAGDPLLGTRPADPYGTLYPHNQLVLNPKGLQAPYGEGNLFDRTPQAALFYVYHEQAGVGPYVPVYLINNHFKSGPDTNVARRTAQAEYNAALVAELLAARPGAPAVVAGDLNVYPDSPQLASLYGQMSNLYYAMPPVANYSYVFAGQTQTLDQAFVTTALSRTLQAAHYVHFDADYPGAALRLDPGGFYAESDHDPLLAVYQWGYAGVALSPAAAAQSARQGTTVTYTLALTNTGTLTDTITLALGPHTWTMGLSPAQATLAPGASTTVEVYVTVPALAPRGMSAVANVTATGGGGASASSALTTTAAWYQLLLPGVFSGAP